MRISSLVMFIAATLACAHAAAVKLPSIEQVRNTYVSSEAVLLDRNGVPLSEVRRDASARRLAWVPLEDLSPALQSALIASEDRRFYEHSGVDWQAFVGATWDNLWRNLQGRRPRGASTLTMQLAGLLDPALRAKGQTRTFLQKWDQALAARELERAWSKQQIIEAYLNLAPFRGELQGVHAASRALFGKHPSGIDSREALITAALLRGPNAAPQVVARRACAVAAQLEDAPSCAQIQELALSALSGKHRIPPQRNLAPHLAQRLLKAPGETVRTTLDAKLQESAIGTLRTQLEKLEEHDVVDSAVVIIDNASGDVLAYVGGGSESSGAREEDGVAAVRPAGPTLSPFLYQLALEKRLLTAASILDDSPGGPTVPDTAHSLQERDREFKGPVTVRTALASSLSVPAVRALGLVGADALQERLRQLGFEGLSQDPEPYGFSVAMGSVEVDLLQLTNAFRALARGGEWSAWRVTPPDADPDQRQSRRQVMRADANFIVVDILADRSARAASFGSENPLVWSAVKAGTSKDMRHSWCVGFSERYSVGVRLGNSSDSETRDVPGTSRAVPVWRELMQLLHAELASTPPKVPPGVGSRIVSFEPPIEVARKEWFIAGAETGRGETSAAAKAVVAVPRIAYPGNGAVIALAPDVPEWRQRVVFQSRPAAAGLTWRLNGIALQKAGWAPSAGRHRLELVDGTGQVFDAVSFEVRIAPPAPESEQSPERGGE
jgi:penicillin-binding protein 1C